MKTETYPRPPLQPPQNYFLLFQTYYGELIGWQIRTRVPVEEVPETIRLAGQEWLGSREGQAFIQENGVGEKDVVDFRVWGPCRERGMAAYSIFRWTRHSGIIALDGDEVLGPSDQISGEEC